MGMIIRSWKIEARSWAIDIFELLTPISDILVTRKVTK
jgi:hypothetical protein